MIIQEENKPSFEESLPIIQTELNKRRHKWHLKAIMWMDWDDVYQIIIFHIFKKWEQYKPSEGPLVRWVNRIISNQFINILRNVYMSSARPCITQGGCYYNLGDDSCGYTTNKKQCSECKVYAIWEQSSKKQANNLKLSLPMENHLTEIFNLPSQEFDYEKAESCLHKEMKKILRPHEWRVYELMIIMHLSDSEIAKKLNFKSSERFRRPGYGTLTKMRKLFIEKARKIKEEHDLF